MTDIPFGLVRQCIEDAHEAWKALIEESLNKVTNIWNNCRIKDTSQDTDIWFNELFDLNLRLKKIKSKCEKYNYELKAHVFDVLTEEYKPVRVSCNVNISNMSFKDLKKDTN